MKDFLPFVIVGLATGSVYGIAGMGLVLTYRTTGIFNFAHGAIATSAAFLFYQLHFVENIAWPLAALISLLVVGGLGGLVMQRVARDLADVSAAMKIVATVGLIIFIQSLFVAIYHSAAREFPPFLPTANVRIAGVNFGWDQFIVMGIAFVAAAGLYAFFRYSRLGVAMRGVVDDPDLIQLSGTSATAIRTWAWTIGTGFAALSGLLLGPSIGLDAFLLTLLVVQAFGAAAIGAFSNLPMTYLGGLMLGVASAIATKYVPDVRQLSGLPPSLPFIVLFVFLLVTRKWQPLETATRLIRSGRERAQMPQAARWGGGIAFLALMLLIPHIVSSRLPVYTNGLIFVIVFAALALLVRTSGQVSLSQAAFAAVGASTFSHLAHGAGLPWLLALVLSGLVTMPVAALLAIPTLRLAGIYLALATFGFGILLQRMVFTTGLMFGSGQEQRVVPRPGVGSLSSDTGFYYVVLAIVAVCVGLIALIHRSRLGRLLRAMGDSPLALATHGTNVNVTRVIVFTISAFFTGIAGGLFGALTNTINGVGFTSTQSLLWLVLLAISGPGLLRASVVAGGLIAVLPSYLFRWRWAVDYLPVVFGISAVVVAMVAGGRYDVSAWMRRRAQRATDRARTSPVAERVRESIAVQDARAPTQVTP
jgi:branched-subunit amino acid ABC-type transport system permease component